jgi:hypothetical protein
VFWKIQINSKIGIGLFLVVWFFSPLRLCALVDRLGG